MKNENILIGFLIVFSVLKVLETIYQYYTYKMQSDKYYNERRYRSENVYLKSELKNQKKIIEKLLNNENSNQ